MRDIENVEVEVTDEELLEFLEKREVTKAKRATYNKEHGGNNWERQKARMEEDPAYKEEVLAKRKEYQEKRKLELEANPELKEAEAVKRKAYNDGRRVKEQALLSLARSKGLVDENGNIINS